ncbi:MULTISPECIES: hypothetical protein [Serratia]|uniref:hypothetical protein n=1 Tax=Serratia TaxID=613 RepID=UPI0011F1AA42|nr:MULTISPECIES: hypothetical protein [Serratia]NRN16153.1 hypothetical protein [Serratia marcescens]NRN38926.1 hypothetical protein [Serratia marcescens]
MKRLLLTLPQDGIKGNDNTLIAIQDISQHAKSRIPTINLKIKQIKNTFHINTIATLFAPSLPHKKQNP